MSETDSSYSEASADAGGASRVMENLTPDDFAAFFRDIHDHPPFPWQQRLTTQVLSRGAWPKVIDLPTGTGKTAVLDTAVFALAARPAISPRRVVFVIDRRIVVDQVCKRAQRIRDRIEAGRTPILQLVRDHLGALSGGKPLGVAALRGGVPIDNEWTHRPDQPWVMVSTVDQFGSRLLFRGYGVTPGMRPIHAGLAGNDCLVILDEVHLSVPFAETLAQVAALECGRLPRRFGVVEMSATPSDKEAERFALDPGADLEECEELSRRVTAAKEAELITVRNHDAMPAAVLKIVKSIAKQNPDKNVRSIGVVVNRVRTARDTHRALEEAGYTTSLITGRMRPLDRVDVLDGIAPAVDPDGERNTDELTVVVATQAIEVGADFSFDALITECAAVDSLRQRFGRLDRRGSHFNRTGQRRPSLDSRPEISRGLQEARSDLRRFGEGDLGGTRTASQVRPNPRRPTLSDGFPRRSDRSQGLCAATAENAYGRMDPDQPGADRAALRRVVSPTVSSRTGRQVRMCSILWRWDRSPEVLRLVPPRQAEFLPVPIDAAKSWLSGGGEVDVSDVAQVGDARDDSSSPDNDIGPDWIRWEGFGKAPEHVSVDKIRPGDVLIVDPSRGGLKAGTWDPSSTEPVVDLGDAAQIAYGPQGHVASRSAFAWSYFTAVTGRRSRSRYPRQGACLAVAGPVAGRSR